ncbi:MAG TPA: hypothetical protein VL625_04810 [Patescibacteria group bacterium]|nr:hypothetical protein [Patescibacteria group bacterium]
MKDRAEVAPSLEDLSYAQVESSYLFGFTNMSGKAMALISLATLIPGAVGVAQGMEWIGPVLGMSTNFWTGLALTGISSVAGLTGYWLGNFDDKKIRAYNEQASYSVHSYARGKVYDRVERGLVETLSAVEYDPQKKHLPYDALGYAVLLADDKIADLPAHVQVDIYRTQLDLELYKYKQLVSAHTREGLALEAKIMGADVPMEKKAEEYRQGRDRVRAGLKNNTLTITPVTQAHYDEGGSRLTGNDTSDDWLWMRGRGGYYRGGFSGGGSGGSGGFNGFGGGRSGGGGASGSWDDAPGFAPVLSGSGSSGSSGGSSGSGKKSGGGDLGKAAGGGLGLLIKFAGVAAVIAATAVTAFSLRKNFFTEADKPVLAEGVRVPMLAKSLATAEKDIRRMYAPS